MCLVEKGERERSERSIKSKPGDCLLTRVNMVKSMELVSSENVYRYVNRTSMSYVRRIL
jgi:hypothetical protein